MATYNSAVSTNAPGSRIVVNNATEDPLQGFQTSVWVNDQATGDAVFAGGFTSFQTTMRNATEPYMPFGRKTPRLLDGEFQFGWVLERGLLDIRVLQEAFGFPNIGAEYKADPTPRFMITVAFNAPELDNAPVYYGPNGDNVGQTSTASGTTVLGNVNQRMAIGSYQLSFAKIDSITLGAMAGRNIVANRFEGLCEDIRFVSGSQVSNYAYNGSAAMAVAPQYSGNPVTTAVSLTGVTGTVNYLFG